MAKIFVLDNTHKQVGSIDFTFMVDTGGSYIYLDINNFGGIGLGLERCVMLNRQGAEIALITSRSSGGAVQVSEVYAGGKRYQTGLVFESVVKINDGFTEVVVGDVAGTSVRDKTQKIVGEVVLHWSSEDEGALRSAVETFARQTGMEGDRVQGTIEMLRPYLNQMLLNIGGGAALIMKLFEPKKRG